MWATAGAKAELKKTHKVTATFSFPESGLHSIKQVLQKKSATGAQLHVFISDSSERPNCYFKHQVSILQGMELWRKVKHNKYFLLAPVVRHWTFYKHYAFSAKSCSEAFRHTRTVWWRHKRIREGNTLC